MKRILLTTTIFVLAALCVFAASGSAPLSDTAKVKLDLDVEKFVIGFANSEENAKAFTVHSGDFLMISSYSDSTTKTEVKISQDTPMYFFYDAAMKRNNKFKLEAEIVKPLTQQNDTDTGDATNPDTIQYTATITGDIGYDDFKDGTWVTAATTLITLDSSNESGASKSGTVLSDLRGSATAPFTVVYASAMKIELAVKDGQHLEAKKSAVYRSEIKFTVKSTT